MFQSLDTTNFWQTNLTSFMEEKVKKEMDNRSLIFATKDDIANLKADIANVKTDVANVKAEVANVKADIIKWMFVFWIGQFAATFGFILLFLKK